MARSSAGARSKHARATLAASTCALHGGLAHPASGGGATRIRRGPKPGLRNLERRSLEPASKAKRWVVAHAVRHRPPPPLLSVDSGDYVCDQAHVRDGVLPVTARAVELDGPVRERTC